MSRIIRGNFGAVPYTRLILKQTSGNNIIRVSVGKPSLPVWTVESPGQSSKVLLRTLNQGT